MTRQIRPAGAAVLVVLAVTFITIAATRGDVAAQDQGWTPINGLPFTEPREIRSKDGVLRARIRIAEGPVTVSGDQVVAKTYDGSYVGPTLRVRPGDTMRIIFVNALSEPTNVHFHGLHVSPEGRGDNVFRHIHPGTSARYTIRLPADHNPGSFWYHSHQHGSAEEQVFDGLSGVLIVEGLERMIGRAMPERTFALKDLQTTGDAIDSSGIDSDQATNRTVNGNVLPTLAAGRAGRRQLWHLANIGADIFYALDFSEIDAVVVAEDGNPLTGALPAASQLVLPPGKRYDVVVRGSPGPFTLTTLYYDQGGDKYPTTPLVEMDFGPPPATTEALPRRLRHTTRSRTRALPRGKRRRFVFSSEDDTKFLINGRQFNPRDPVRASLGTVERWTLLNVTTEQHPFHLHQYDFRVLSVNGVPYDAASDQDTVILPPVDSEGNPGKVVIRVPLTDFPGKSVFHCHILAHEDGGMMKALSVSGRGP